MVVTIKLLIFSIGIGILSYILLTLQSRIPFSTYFSPPLAADSSPVQEECMPSVSSESVHLQGWHKRALSHPHPNPHSITPEDDIVELVVTSTSMVKSFGLPLVIFRSTANISSGDDFGADNGNDSYHYIAVDELGRVSVLPSISSDINGILSLGRQVVLKSPIAEPWERQDDVTCLPLYTISIALDSEESKRNGSKGRRDMKTVNIIGYPGMNWIKVRNKGYDYLPDSVRDLFLLVLEAGEWNEEPVDKVVIEKVEKGTGYYLDW